MTCGRFGARSRQKDSFWIQITHKAGVIIIVLLIISPGGSRRDAWHAGRSRFRVIAGPGGRRCYGSCCDNGGGLMPITMSPHVR